MALKAAVNLFFERDSERDSERDTGRETPKGRDKVRDRADSGENLVPQPSAATWGELPNIHTQEWGPETLAHIACFETTAPPVEPFELQPGVWIAHPAR